jgi:hypothetical protein
MKSKAVGKIYCVHSDIEIRRDDCVPNIDKVKCPKCKVRQKKNPRSINEGVDMMPSPIGSPGQLAEDAALYQYD